jgi:hypothetical protein
MSWMKFRSQVSPLELISQVFLFILHISLEGFRDFTILIIEYLASCLCNETAVALREALHLLYCGLGDVERYKYAVFGILGIESAREHSREALSHYNAAYTLAPWNGHALKSISLIQR